VSPSCAERAVACYRGRTRTDADSKTPALTCLQHTPLLLCASTLSGSSCSTCSSGAIGTSHVTRELCAHQIVVDDGISHLSARPQHVGLGNEFVHACGGRRWQRHRVCLRRAS
jgi:hypothetical protein